MTDINLLNDPEYRWTHKEEMLKIMPYTSIRNQLGIKVIDYTKLRHEYLSKIKEKRKYELNWERFKQLIFSVPYGLDRSEHKSQLQPKDMYHFERRDGCECYLCGTISRFTHFHHIIPNGEVTNENIVTLCHACHDMVHLALYTSGRWRHTRK